VLAPDSLREIFAAYRGEMADARALIDDRCASR
jgi:hypothetical protein